MKATKCPLMSEWISKTWYVHTTGYYSALKKEKVLTCAMTWMKLEDIMLSKMSQPQKDKYCVTPLTRHT